MNVSMHLPDPEWEESVHIHIDQNDPEKSQKIRVSHDGHSWEGTPKQFWKAFTDTLKVKSCD